MTTGAATIEVRRLTAGVSAVAIGGDVKSACETRRSMSTTEAEALAAAGV